MDQENISQEPGVDLPDDQSANYGRTRTRQGENRLIWEMPLGIIRGVLTEPDAGFVDSDEAAEREAIQWEGA
jgi:hypothetical protein